MAAILLLVLMQVAGISAANDMVRVARDPAILPCEIGSAAQIALAEDSTRSDMAGELAGRIIDAAADNPDQWIVVSLQNVPLRYEQLSQDQRERIDRYVESPSIDPSEQTPADFLAEMLDIAPFTDTSKARFYERKIAAFLTEVLDQVKAQRPGTAVSIMGLPAEPWRAHESTAEATNMNLAPVLDRLDVFASSHSFIRMRNGAPEMPKLVELHARLPETFRLRDGRPVLFRIAGRWAIVTDAESASYFGALEDAEEASAKSETGDEPFISEPQSAQDPFEDPTGGAGSEGAAEGAAGPSEEVSEPGSVGFRSGGGRRGSGGSGGVGGGASGGGGGGGGGTGGGGGGGAGASGGGASSDSGGTGGSGGERSADDGGGANDVDSDGDGVLDHNDGCPNDPNKTEPGDCGCGVADTDTDGDGVPDCIDGCPNDPNKTNPGACGCGEPDTDTDGDGWPDCVDECPDDPDKTEPGICGCGEPDNDCNDNGICDSDDIAGPTSEDCNGNGIPDECDIADGISEDCNENGIPDDCDIADGTSADENANGIPDECESGGGPPPVPVITLLESNSPRIAPHTVHVHATASDLGHPSYRWQRTKFEWDFGDTAVTPMTTIDPRNGDTVDLNTQQQGFNAAYIYQEPGTYTITLTVTNEGLGEASTTTNVTIVPDTRTIRYVDALDGSDNNSGLTPNSAWRTVDKALDDVASNRKILFKRGQVFEVTTNQRITGNCSNIILGTYGSGDKPIIRWTGSNEGGPYQILSIGDTTENIVVRHLVFDGTYDWTISDVQGLAMHGKNMTAHDYEIRNAQEGVDLRDSIGFYSLNAVHGRTKRMSWLILDSESAVITGCSALTSYEEHIIRMLRANNPGEAPNYRVSIGWCDFDLENLIGKELIRYEAAQWAITYSCLLRQGEVDFGHQGGDTDYIVFQSNRCESCSKTNICTFKPNAHHLMIRNNVFLMQDNYRMAFNVTKPWEEMSVKHVDIYNNTIVCATSVGFVYAPQFNLRHPDIQLDDVHVMNNLLVGGVELRGEEDYRINDAPGAYQFRNNVMHIDPGNGDWARVGSPAIPFDEWVSKPFVTNELQIDISPSEMIAPGYEFPAGYPEAESYGEFIPGLFEDYNGVPYPTDGPVTPGAAQAS